MRHTRLDLGLSWFCASDQALSVARPVLPNFELPRRIFENSLWLYCAPAEQPVLYTNIIILLTILCHFRIVALYYCKFVRNKIFFRFFYIFLYFFSYYIQHCFICRPTDSTVPTDAGIEPGTVATGA
jgi:hypothetical protein